MKMRKINIGFKRLERERLACIERRAPRKTVSVKLKSQIIAIFIRARRSRQARRSRSSQSRLGGISILLCAVLLNFACTPRSFEKPNAAAPQPTAAEDKQASFQNELQKMKTANLQYVFVFRRKDGAAVDGEDKKFLRANLPFNNRVVLADEDKAVIVGSNYKFPNQNIDALRARFNVEDYSAPEEQQRPAK